MLRMSDNSFEIITQEVDRRGEKAFKGISPKRDGFTRQDVVNAIMNTFELIGGQTRFAIWADSNPDKFYSLYSKLLPSTTVNIGIGQDRVIRHAIPRGKLDEFPEADSVVDVEYSVEVEGARTPNE